MNEDLLDLLAAWLDSKPKVRGYDIDDAELRLRCDGEGRIAVSLRSKNPEAEFQATALCILEHLEEATRGMPLEEGLGEELKDDESVKEQVGLIRELKQGEEWKGDESRVFPPPSRPQRAFADFESRREVEEILTGKKEARFYFEDEAEWTGDPLIDP